MVKEKQTVIAKIFSILLVLADKSFIGDEILLAIYQPQNQISGSRPSSL
jgi:hypothetical protein